MKPRLILCLALFLSEPAFVETTPASPPRSGANPDVSDENKGETKVYRDADHGFEFTTPSNWTVTKTNFTIFHYNEVFLTVNNQRPDLTVRKQPTDKRTFEYNENTIFQQMQPGEVYISFGYAEGPLNFTMQSDAVTNDLLRLLPQTHFESSPGRKLSSLNLGFYKRGRTWSINAYLREPVVAATSNQVFSMLRSFRFVDRPIRNAAWAESLAWNELPDNVRDFGHWPVAVDVGQRAQYGQNCVMVDHAATGYSVTFILKGLKTWNYSVLADGKVHSESTTASAVSVPLSRLPSDLPGKNKAKAATHWVAPHVLAFSEFGKTMLTWFNPDGSVGRQAAVGDIQQGLVEIPGGLPVIRAINENWQITLPREPSDPSLSGYINSTADSRVFVHERHPGPGLVALDIYVHGKLANTLGPFFQYLANDVALSEDGAAGLLIWKNASRTNVQIVTLTTNGNFQFRVDSDTPVTALVVAPGGTGALVRSNTGTNQNAFIWFTEHGKIRSLSISPNPQCVGWIPQSCSSLFLTSVGYGTERFQLVDWTTGKLLWNIPCPGGGKVLAIGLTPKFIVLSVAKPYPPSATLDESESLLESGKEWVRTFYAVKAQDGKLVAHFRGQFPRGYRGADNEHFLALADKFFYIADEEFTELDLKDIAELKNGWLSP